jgi:hypothetical protein
MAFTSKLVVHFFNPTNSTEFLKIKSNKENIKHSAPIRLRFLDIWHQLNFNNHKRKPANTVTDQHNGMMLPKYMTTVFRIMEVYGTWAWLAPHTTRIRRTSTCEYTCNVRIYIHNTSDAISETQPASSRLLAASQIATADILPISPGEVDYDHSTLNLSSRYMSDVLKTLMAEAAVLLEYRCTNTSIHGVTCSIRQPSSPVRWVVEAYNIDATVSPWTQWKTRILHFTDIPTWCFPYRLHTHAQ